MRVAFVKPSMNGSRAADALEPTVFAILSALTPPDVGRALYDERLEEVPFDEPCDLAAISVDTFTARRAYQIAAEYRAHGVPVVMGGFHPTLCPEEATGHADAVVTGDAEEAWPRVVADARRGRLRRLYAGGRPPFGKTGVDRGIFRGKRYGPVALVQFGRGCRNACDFCAIKAFYGGSLRQRAVEDVAREVRGLRGRHVFFTDDNIFAERERARQLFELLMPIGARWSCQVSLDVIGHRDVLELMARSGCRSVTVGFESFRPGSLRQMGKAWNLDHGGYAAVVRAFRERGIMVYGTFVFGYDGDTPATIETALDFALRERLFLANFNPLTPMPGTPLYRRLFREGRLSRPRWWLDPDYRYGQVPFHPRGMSAEELAAGCWRARTEFNRWANIARRAVDLRANLRDPRNALTFLAANVVSRREISRKQGLPLGRTAGPTAVGAAT
jgi:radical SAM superfamily enzyme YgiQ (UPF0313 family)